MRFEQVLRRAVAKPRLEPVYDQAVAVAVETLGRRAVRVATDAGEKARRWQALVTDSAAAGTAAESAVATPC